MYGELCVVTGVGCVMLTIVWQVVCSYTEGGSVMSTVGHVEGKYLKGKMEPTNVKMVGWW